MVDLIAGDSKGESLKRYATRSTPGSVATGCATTTKEDRGVTKWASTRILRSLLFPVKADFSRRICDGAQPSTTPRRKCCQPPGRRSFNEGGTDDSQLRKGAWLPRSFTLSTINIPPAASAAR